MVSCGVCKYWGQFEAARGVCNGISGEGWSGDPAEQAMLSDPGSLYTKIFFGCTVGELREDAVIERLGEVSDG